MLQSAEGSVARLCGQEASGSASGETSVLRECGGEAVAEVGGTRQEGAGRRGCRDWGTR